MAITPVKTGNVPTPPPVKPADSKLTAQFNAAAKQDVQMVEKKPIFYTPTGGSFKEARTIEGKKVNARLNWKVSETQPKVTDNVNIKGSVTIDWKDKRGKVAYTIDANKSFITKEGAVVYSVQGVLYRSSHNIFKPIKADVMSALKEVTGNTKNFNDKDNKTTPVSWASAKLTRALNAVGEQNLRYGIGLGGAGEEIKTVLNQQLANTKNTPLERNAIALAITSAGVRLYDVPNKPGILQIASKPKKDDAGSSSETYPMLQGDEVRELNIEDGVAGTIQNLRIGTNADRNVRVNPAEEETLYNRAFAHYTNPDNLRAVAAAYAQQIAAPGTVIQNGLTLAQADNVRDAIQTLLLDGLGDNLVDYNLLLFVLDEVGITGRAAQQVAQLIGRSPILTPQSLRVAVRNVVTIINNNVRAFELAQEGTAYMNELMGIAANQFGSRGG